MDWEEIGKIIKDKAPLITQAVQKAATSAHNEAEFRSVVSKLIEEFANHAEVTLLPREEYTVASGKADAVFNRLVLEYKKPGILHKTLSHRNNQEAIKQIKGYMDDIAKKERHHVQRMAGVILDGNYFIFLRNLDDTWHKDDPLEVNRHSVSQFLKLLVSPSSGVALTSEILIQDFGTEHLRAQKLVRAIQDSFLKAENSLVQKLFEQWKIHFSEVIEYKDAFSSTKLIGLRKFARKAGVELKDAEVFFFSIHTYFALLVKLLAWVALSRYISPRFSAPPFGKLSALSSEELQRELAKMEQGGIFREGFGIRNLLEGDFFSWYLHAWNAQLEDALRGLLNRLNEYDPTTLEVNPEETRDLLKKLYHYLMPKEIRHNLGEYYTPDWLAQRLLNQIDQSFFMGNPEKSRYIRENVLKLRLLDPACGSGTFLVLIIKRIKEVGKNLLVPEEHILNAILKNVVGIDLNPLACIAARTNYLLALGELLEHRKKEIDIPVYLADSILTPSQGDDLFKAGKYTFKTSVGEFEVPQEVCHREKIDILCNLLEEGVRDGISVEAFLDRCKAHLHLREGEIKKASETLSRLFEKIASLHKGGMNGVWARIIKNAFAPLFIGRFNYVVGNPPWVNWESLPEGYRQDMKPLWEKAGLFPHGGMDTILGKGKKDISMLMSYVGMDRYLERHGKLGFVITQSVFKTSGAGQGFRRFRLGDKGPIKVICVDDMVELKPFEGAANRTSVVVLKKGSPTTYPVPYNYWKKTVRGRSIGYTSELDEVMELTERKNFIAQPVDVKDPTSPWLTGSPQALRAIRKVLGESEYEAHEGVNSGGANGVYWVDIVGKRPDGLVMVHNITEGAKREVEEVTMAIEPDLLYPLLRGRDVQRWQAQPSAYILMAQDPIKRRGIDKEDMQRNYPKTYSYLKRFEKELRERAALKRYFTRRDKTGKDVETGPFYSMFDVGQYTFAPYKVVWREQAAGLTCAVVEKQERKAIVPDHKLMLVPFENKNEAYFVVGILNASPSRCAVISYAVEIQMTTHITENIRIPRFDPKNPLHRRLSELSQKAHCLGEGKTEELKAVEEEIDHSAAQLWGINERELKDIKLSLEEL